MFSINNFSASTANSYINSHDNQRNRFLRHESTSNFITNVEAGCYPSLEKDPILKERVISVFTHASPFSNKANRPDVPVSNSDPSADDMLTIRDRISSNIKNMPDELQQRFDNASENNDFVTIQRIYGELVAKAYKNNQASQDNLSPVINVSEYKEGAPTYCLEISYLVYNLLCEQGVDPEEMRVVCFTDKNQCDPDFANDHALIIYSSDKNLLKNMESDCGAGEGNAGDNSYSDFIDLCVKINKEKEIVLIIDPWSKDNKIIDPLIKDDVFLSIKEEFPNKNEKEIEKIFLKTIIDGTLTESDVLDVDHHQYSFSTDYEVSVHIDVPILASSSDSSSDESDSSDSNMEALRHGWLGV